MNPEKIRLAMAALVNIPGCGIGESGPTQKELDAAVEGGMAIDGDATYHNAQQAWLLLRDFVAENK